MHKSHTVKWQNKYWNLGSEIPESAILTTIPCCLKNQVNDSQGVQEMRMKILTTAELRKKLHPITKGINQTDFFLKI